MIALPMPRMFRRMTTIAATAILFFLDACLFAIVTVATTVGV
jgi:hypothetical protein